MENPYPWNELFSSILANFIFVFSLVLCLVSLLDCPLSNVQTCSVNSITQSPREPPRTAGTREASRWLVMQIMIVALIAREKKV